MFTLLMTLFIILSLFLALFIYIQQGKGDAGMAFGGGGGLSLFGGSGGQSFFEKTTWILGILFIFGALALSIIKTTSSETKLKGYQSTAQEKNQQAPKQK